MESARYPSSDGGDEIDLMYWCDDEDEMKNVSDGHHDSQKQDALPTKHYTNRRQDPDGNLPR